MDAVLASYKGQIFEKQESKMSAYTVSNSANKLIIKIDPKAPILTVTTITF